MSVGPDRVWQATSSGGSSIMDFKSFSLAISQTKVARFADDLAGGKNMATVCKKCGKKYYPPQADCPECMSSDMDWKELKGERTLRIFTRIYVPPEHVAPPQPPLP